MSQIYHHGHFDMFTRTDFIHKCHKRLKSDCAWVYHVLDLILSYK